MNMRVLSVLVGISVFGCGGASAVSPTAPNSSAAAVAEYCLDEPRVPYVYPGMALVAQGASTEHKELRWGGQRYPAPSSADEIYLRLPTHHTDAPQASTLVYIAGEGDDRWLQHGREEFRRFRNIRSLTFPSDHKNGIRGDRRRRFCASSCAVEVWGDALYIGMDGDRLRYVVMRENTPLADYRHRPSDPQWILVDPKHPNKASSYVPGWMALNDSATHLVVVVGHYAKDAPLSEVR